MEPIISPWLIYFMSVSSQFKVVFVSMGGASLLAFLIFLVRVLVAQEDVYAQDRNVSYERNEKNEKKLDNARTKYKSTKKHLYKPLIMLLLFIIVAVVIPSQQTIIQMIVAKNITPNNLSAVVKEGRKIKENIKKDVLDIIMAINKEKK